MTLVSIDEILERKQALFDELVDDVSLNLSTQLSDDELFGLFGLEGAHDRDRQGAHGSVPPPKA